MLSEVETERNLKVTGQGAAASGSAPVIDMSGADETIAADIMRAASEVCSFPPSQFAAPCRQFRLAPELVGRIHILQVGFFSVTNHGIPEEVIAKAFGASADFFSQPKEVKEKQMPWRRDMNSGYEYFAQIRPSTGTPDQKESLQITAREGAMENGWPPVDSFEPAANELLNQAHALSQRILSLLEPIACPHLAPGTLAKAHTLWGPHGQSTLRMLHYPPVEPADVPEGYWRGALAAAAALAPARCTRPPFLPCHALAEAAQGAHSAHGCAFQTRPSACPACSHFPPLPSSSWAAHGLVLCDPALPAGRRGRRGPRVRAQPQGGWRRRLAQGALLRPLSADALPCSRLPNQAASPTRR